MRQLQPVVREDRRKARVTPARRYEPKRLRLRLFAVAAHWSAAGAACACVSRRPAPGPGSWSPPSPGFRHCLHRPDQHRPAPTTRTDTPRARGTPPTRRDSRATRPTTAVISHSSRTTQPATGWARKIEVNASAIRGYDLGDTAISLAGLGGRLGERHARVYLPKGARGRRGIPTATLLPYCEGDGSNQQGQHFYDDSLYADPVRRYLPPPS